jgi:protein-tyrosine-phosphatase
MHFNRSTSILLANVLLAFAVLACRAADGVPSTPPTSTVLMICEHGSVKSLMAASLFNAEASRRGLPFRAVARGLTPDAAVPTTIAAAMKQEGFDVSQFKPSAVSNDDVAQSAYVVTIGIEPAKVAGNHGERSEQWDDVPAASVDYASAHAVLQRHVDQLLDKLGNESPADLLRIRRTRELK